MFKKITHIPCDSYPTKGAQTPESKSVSNHSVLVTSGLLIRSSCSQKENLQPKGYPPGLIAPTDYCRGE